MKEAIIQYNDNPDADGGHMVISYKSLVRCKDCKYYTAGYACQYIDVYPYPEPDWFCADGKRREDNERKTSAESGE